MIFYFYRHSDVKRIKVDENIEIKITKNLFREGKRFY